MNIILTILIALYFAIVAIVLFILFGVKKTLRDGKEREYVFEYFPLHYIGVNITCIERDGGGKTCNIKILHSKIEE